MEQIELRKAKLREIDDMYAAGQLTPEEFKQAKMMYIGLQPTAKAQPASIAEYDAYKKMPPEERQGFDTFRNSKQQFIVDNRREPREPREGLSPAQQAATSARLRNEMKGNPYVKNFQDVDSKYQVMIKALEEAPRAGTLVAVDQALISLFNKMTDPQSVVRESEYARTSRDMGLLNRIKGKAEKVISGGAGLTSDERQALVDMGTKFYNAYAGNYNDSINNMNELSQLEGIDPRRVNTTYRPAKLREEKGATGSGQGNLPQNITQADINATALKYKMTPQQVKQKLGIR
jgi:hypothetical protein